MKINKSQLKQSLLDVRHGGYITLKIALLSDTIDHMVKQAYEKGISDERKVVASMITPQAFEDSDYCHDALVEIDFEVSWPRKEVK